MAWAQQPPDACARVAALSLEHARVAAVTVNGGAQLADTGLKPADALPSFCRVQIEDHPSADSAIHTEVWLPAAGWNHRLRGFGNGGFAGNLSYRGMAAAVSQGYATVSTDAGHTGQDPSFALGHPERIADFGWRAVHDMTVEAKQVVAAFYGQPAAHAYFTACSDGGREALMEVERFPADYDGVLAGAPAYNWSALVSSAAADEQRLHASARSEIPAAKLPAIARAVRAACAGPDGVIADPTACHFDPQTLVCRGAESDACLLPEQAAALAYVYAPKQDAQGGLIEPGVEPGAEGAERNGFGDWIVGGHALYDFFALGYFRDFVFDSPQWTFKEFSLGRDYAAATAKTGGDLNATNADIHAFLDRGGKLVLYHGWADAAIPAMGTVDYFRAVVQAVGWAEINRSVRLYMAPGMLHCEGGDGATNFGQDEAAARGGARRDVVTALEQWVEAGRAPGALVAGGAAGVTRTLCPYPQKAGGEGQASCLVTARARP